MPIFNVQVKRTHKFTMQIEAPDLASVPQLAKQLVKDGNPTAREYEVKFAIAADVIDPDALPVIP